MSMSKRAEVCKEADERWVAWVECLLQRQPWTTAAITTTTRNKKSMYESKQSKHSVIPGGATPAPTKCGVGRARE